MKTAENTLTLTKSEEFKAATTTEANIKRSAAAYHILSNSLYSNKILAATRETICNALDISRKTGTAHPIQITIPSLFAKTGNAFIVRDWGTGLSEQEIRELALTYFETSKSASNDEIGGFGLGFKAPLAYTDGFQITSRQNGTKTTYAVFFNENRIPSVTKLGASQTEDPNGLEISIPVKASDFQEFTHTVQRLAYFIPKHLIYTPGLPTRYCLDHNPIFNTPHFISATPDYRPSLQRGGVVMGMVHYPIDLQNLPASLRDDLRLLDGGYLQAEIGYLNLAPNREALSYDRTTIANLRLLVNEAIMEIKQAMKELIEASTTPAHTSEICARMAQVINAVNPQLGAQMATLRKDLNRPNIQEAFLQASQSTNMSNISSTVLTQGRWRRNGGTTTELSRLCHGLHQTVGKPGYTLIQVDTEDDYVKISKLLRKDTPPYSLAENLLFITASTEQLAVIAKILDAKTVEHWTDRQPKTRKAVTNRTKSTPVYALIANNKGGWTKTRISKRAHHLHIATDRYPVILASTDEYNFYSLSGNFNKAHSSINVKHQLDIMQRYTYFSQFPPTLPIILKQDYDPNKHRTIAEWTIDKLIARVKTNDEALAGLSLALPQEQYNTWWPDDKKDRELLNKILDVLTSIDIHDILNHCPADLDIKQLNGRTTKIMDWQHTFTSVINQFACADLFANTVNSLPTSTILTTTVQLMKKYPDLVNFLTRNSESDPYSFFTHYFALVNNTTRSF